MKRRPFSDLQRSMRKAKPKKQEAEQRQTELMKRYEGQGPELTEAEMDELRRLENRT